MYYTEAPESSSGRGRSLFGVSSGEKNEGSSGWSRTSDTRIHWPRRTSVGHRPVLGHRRGGLNPLNSQPKAYRPSKTTSNRLAPLRTQGFGWGRSDRLGERQEIRFENLKVFEFDPMLLGGSAPKPPGFFEAWRRTSTYCLRTSAALQ